MVERTDAPANTEPGVIAIERTFDAPRELVWKAWTDPNHVMRWWGPKTFTSPAAEIDFRVGGKFLFAMRSPEFQDGRTGWNTGEYREIVPFERIVCTMAMADEKGNVVPPREYGMPADVATESLLTVEFEVLGDGQTKMKMRHEGLPAGEMSDGANEGWNESFDKLAASLAA